MSVRDRLSRSAIAGLASVTLVAGLGASSIAVATSATATPGASAAAPAAAPAKKLDSRTVAKMQRKLNDLGFPKLGTDGVFGDYTRNVLCMWREVFNKKLPHRGNPTDYELKRLFAATSLPSPRDRMIVGLNVNKTCQAVFWVAEGPGGAPYYKDIMRASTGSPTAYGEDKSTASGRFRVYNAYPKWSNSTQYPLEDGCKYRGPNPYCGNMWRPIYFNAGEAFHGRSSADIPIDPFPASHGCVRLAYKDIDKLWKGGMSALGTPVKIYGEWKA